MQEYFTCDHKHIPKIREIMSVFPNISNIINSIDVVAKTCGGRVVARKKDINNRWPKLYEHRLLLEFSPLTFSLWYPRG